MKKVLKKVIFLVLAVAMVLSFNTVAMKNTVKAVNVVPFQVTSPTANKLSASVAVLDTPSTS